MRTLPSYLPIEIGASSSETLKLDFLPKTIVINNIFDTDIYIYFGSKSNVRPDYIVEQFSFAELPVYSSSNVVILEWAASVIKEGFLMVVALEETRPYFYQSNVPKTTGTDINIASDGAGIAKNGTAITGEVLDAGGAQVLGWLSQIVHQLKLGITVNSSSVTKGAITNKSGTITAGGVSQVLAAAKPNRNYFFLQNISLEDMWINFGTNAVADSPSILIQAYDTFSMEGSFMSTDVINIISATTGNKFVAKEG